MWRVFPLASLVVAAGIVMWPERARCQASSAASPVQGKHHLVEVIHYGGNLICHVRLENDVVGSGNNLLGLFASRGDGPQKWHCREIAQRRSLSAPIGKDQLFTG